MQPSIQSLSLDLEQALGWLTQQQWGLERSLDYLNGLQHRTLLLNLYQQCFPRHWKKSRESVLPDEAGYSDREREFFDLLEKYWFPIYIPEEPYSSVVIQCYGFSLYETDSEDLTLTETVVAALYDDLDWSFVVEKFGITVELDRSIPSKQLNWEQIEPAFGTIASPLQYFPQAIQRVGLFTNNLFLDTTWEMEMYEHYPWTLETLRMLRQEWKQAQKLMWQQDLLNLWLLQDPNRVQQIIKIWNQCSDYQQLELPLQIPKFKTISSTALEDELRNHYQQRHYAYL